MKNKLLIFSILILCTSSCNYLEYDESDFLEKDAVFSSFQYTRDFLTNIYSSFPQLFYPLMTRQFFCDFHEKSEDFCVS